MLEALQIFSFPCKRLGPQVSRETVAKLGMLCGPSIMLGRNGLILEKPCSAIDLRHQCNPD